MDQPSSSCLFALGIISSLRLIPRGLRGSKSPPLPLVRERGGLFLYSGPLWQDATPASRRWAWPSLHSSRTENSCTRGSSRHVPSPLKLGYLPFLFWPLPGLPRPCGQGPWAQFSAHGGASRPHQPLTSTPLPQTRLKPKRVKALYNCVADNPDELTFSEGDVIIVDGEEDQEWWVSWGPAQEGGLDLCARGPRGLSPGARSLPGRPLAAGHCAPRWPQTFLP